MRKRSLGNPDAPKNKSQVPCMLTKFAVFHECGKQWHEEHVGDRGHNDLVHLLRRIPKAMNIPSAKAAVDKA